MLQQGLRRRVRQPHSRLAFRVQRPPPFPRMTTILRTITTTSDLCPFFGCMWIAIREENMYVVTRHSVGTTLPFFWMYVDRNSRRKTVCGHSPQHRHDTVRLSATDALGRSWTGAHLIESTCQSIRIPPVTTASRSLQKRSQTEADTTP